MARMEDNVSEFPVEVWAIRLALTWIKGNNDDDVDIRVDSQAALMVACSLYHTSRLVLEAQDILYQQRKNNIWLHRVRAHIGVEGNEGAYQATKKATSQSAVVTVGLWRNYMSKLLRDKLLEDW